MHDRESFQEQARERERMACYSGVVSRIGKEKRNGGESFQEQARHRE